MSSSDRRLSQLDVLTESVNEFVKLIESYTPKVNQQKEPIITLKQDELEHIKLLLDTIAQSRSEAMKKSGKRASFEADEVIPYFRKVICKNLPEAKLDILLNNVTGILNGLSDQQSKEKTASLLTNTRAALEEGKKMYDEKYVKDNEKYLINDEEKINPILEELMELGNNQFYDISFSKDKDAKISKFITETLGSKPDNSDENEQKDYSSKKKVIKLIDNFNKIQALPESDELKYYFKIFALIITMANTTQKSHDSSLITSLVKLSNRLKIPVNNPESTLRKFINGLLQDTLLFTKFINLNVEKNAKDQNLPEEIIQARRDSSCNSYLREALADIIKHVMTDCQSDSGKELAAKLMLKFNKVKDEKFKNLILIQLNNLPSLRSTNRM